MRFLTFLLLPPLPFSLAPPDPSAPSSVLTPHLFCSHTNDLKVHCVREKIPFVAFEDFRRVKEVIASVVKGGKSIEQVLAEEGEH